MSIKYSLPLEAIEEKQLSSENIFDGRVLHIRRDKVSLPDGNTSVREYCHHNGAVCVIPVTDKGEVICVRQYRYAMHEPMLEIPAGKLDYIGEDPAAAAMRELREETGALAGKLTPMGIYYGSPAILDEKIHMYLATSLSFGETELDSDEFLEAVRIPLNELVGEVLAGRIPDGKTQVAALRAYLMLSGDCCGC